jgi:hypothetical protein
MAMDLNLEIHEAGARGDVRGLYQQAPQGRRVIDSPSSRLPGWTRARRSSVQQQQL